MKNINLNVDVHHLSRIEGHGNIKIKVHNGKIIEARWDVVETPRFFEIMLKDKHYTSAGILAARICGICSISHCLSSVLATERAFNLVVPEDAHRIRLIAKHGEILQSHVLHLLFLVAPDFFEEPSVIPLVERTPEVITIACRLKSFSNRICHAVAGRTTHPVALQVGGVSAIPAKKELISFKSELEQIINDLHKVAALFSTLKIPDFIRETEYVSLKGENEYPAMGGGIMTSDGIERSAKEYQSVTNEYVDKNNTTKWTKLSRESYAVGALARFNNNYSLLNPEAIKVANMFGFEPVCHNPFMNNVAQLVESFHSAYEIMRLIDEVTSSDLKDTMSNIKPAAGEGVGIVEAPRGILFHHYKYDSNGRIEKANCVVPTTQNNANIHNDLKSFVEQFALKGMTDEKLELLSSMLVRSYDPCLSCAVH